MNTIAMNSAKPHVKRSDLSFHKSYDSFGWRDNLTITTPDDRVSVSIDNYDSSKKSNPQRMEKLISSLCNNILMSYNNDEYFSIRIAPFQAFHYYTISNAMGFKRKYEDIAAIIFSMLPLTSVILENNRRKWSNDYVLLARFSYEMAKIIVESGGKKTIFDLVLDLHNNYDLKDKKIVHQNNGNKIKSGFNLTPPHPLVKFDYNKIDPSGEKSYISKYFSYLFPGKTFLQILKSFGAFEDRLTGIIQHVTMAIHLFDVCRGFALVLDLDKLLSTVDDAEVRRSIVLMLSSVDSQNLFKMLSVVSYNSKMHKFNIMMRAIVNENILYFNGLEKYNDFDYAFSALNDKTKKIDSFYKQVRYEFMENLNNSTVNSHLNNSTVSSQSLAKSFILENVINPLCFYFNTRISDDNEFKDLMNTLTREAASQSSLSTSETAEGVTTESYFLIQKFIALYDKWTADEDNMKVSFEIFMSIHWDEGDENDR